MKSFQREDFGISFQGDMAYFLIVKTRLTIFYIKRHEIHIRLTILL